MGRKSQQFARLALVGFVMVATSNFAQRNTGFPTPPTPAVPGIEQDQKAAQLPKPKMNFVEMERQSAELSQLAGSIPGDVNMLKMGLYPKDIANKLKRIEKLSKQIRGGIIY